MEVPKRSDGSSYPEWFIDDVVSLEELVKATGHSKVRFRCKIHGEIYSQEIKSHLKGINGCPKCAYEKRAKSNSSLRRERNPFPDWFLQDLDKSVDVTQIKAHSKVKFLCRTHGVYEQDVSSHLSGHGCPQCANLKRQSDKKVWEALDTARYRRKPYPEFFKRDVKDPRELLNKTTHDKVTFVCKKHGDYQQIIDVHLSGHGCPRCAEEKRVEALREQTVVQKRLQSSREVRRAKNPFPDWFLQDLKEPEKFLENPIMQSKQVFLCKEHGEYLQWAYDHLAGHGCPECLKYQSRYEKLVSRLIQNRGLGVVESCRTLIKAPNGKMFELDIYVPERRVAIEIDGLYFHSEEFFSRRLEKFPGGLGGVLPRDYHRVKTDLCEKAGVQLIHIFEDDIKYNRVVTRNLILSKLGLLERKKIGARKTIVCEVGTEEAREFYDANHIQGFGTGQCFGLYCEGRLLSAMSVQRAPANVVDAGSHILNRYASVSDVFVMGGFEKLLHYAERQLQITRWVSYADRTISNGALYRKQGFQEVGRSEPDYKYIVDGRRVHKFNYRIQRFKTDPNLKFQEGLSERQLAELNGIPRIYDCGKIKYIKEVKGEHE